MKRRRDCTCLCHKGGGVILHVVPCCDGIAAGLAQKLKRKKRSTKLKKRTPQQTERE